MGGEERGIGMKASVCDLSGAIRGAMRREELLKRALGNLVRKVNFLTLAQEDPGHIYTRTQALPGRYSIEMSNRLLPGDFDHIVEIVRSLDEDATAGLSEADVEEMFGLRDRALLRASKPVEKPTRRRKSWER